MRLGIKVQDTDAFPSVGQSRRQVNGRRGFAYATLLIDDRD